MVWTKQVAYRWLEYRLHYKIVNHNETHKKLQAFGSLDNQGRTAFALSGYNTKHLSAQEYSSW